MWKDNQMSSHFLPFQLLKQYSSIIDDYGYKFIGISIFYQISNDYFFQYNMEES